MTIYIQIAAIIMLSAFFSGMEIAFVSSNKLRAEMDKADSGLLHRALGVFYARPNNFISTLLVGNNVALVIYGLLMARLISSVPVQIAVGTAVMLVLGEFLPKTIFRLNPNGMMRFFAAPALLCHMVLYPVSRLVSGISRLVLRAAGVRVQGKQADPVFRKVDLDHLVHTNIEEAEDEVEQEVRFFQNALDFRTVKVRECIVPRTEIDAISKSEPLDKLRDKFVQSGHSRVIVYDGDIDEIVGFVHSSDMFTLTPDSDWTAAIRQMPIVPETMNAQRLMQDMLRRKRSIAVVVDEFGGTSGIVTLEDLVEEIFGDIADEHDKENYTARQTAPGEYLLSARLEIEKVNEMFDLQLPQGEDYITIGGLILKRHQSLPRCNDIIAFDRWEFKILQSTSTKIELVALKVRQ